MTIAVTGATGQLGRLVLEELLASQEPAALVAVVRDAGKAEELSARGVQVRVADYSDPAALEAALAGVDKLLLVSGSEVGSRVAQHANVVNAAKAAGVGFIAYTSVLAADTTAADPGARAQGDGGAHPRVGTRIHDPAQRLVHRKLCPGRGHGPADGRRRGRCR